MPSRTQGGASCQRPPQERAPDAKVARVGECPLDDSAAHFAAASSDSIQARNPLCLSNSSFPIPKYWEPCPEGINTIGLVIFTNPFRVRHLQGR
jgi:hypothetical protein